MVSRRPRSCLLLAALVLAASCSGGGDGGDAKGDGTTAGSLQDTRLEVVISWSGTDEERFSGVLDRFTSKTGATVQVTRSADMATELNTRLDDGDPPDVALVPRVGLLGALAGRGALQPLPPATAELVDRNYAPVWRDLGTANGELYGVWFKAENKSTLWFDRRTLERAGVTPPTTWDELRTAATTLAGAGVAPFGLGGADGRSVTDWFENVYLRTAGSNAYIDLARHHLAWDDRSVVEALGTLAQVLRQEWVGEPRTAGFVLAAQPADRPPDAGVIDFPAIGDSPPSVVVDGDAAVLLTDSPGGRALVEFLATPEAGEVWASLGGFTSPNRKLNPAVYPNEAERRAAAALIAAQVVRWDMSDFQPPAFGADPNRGLLPLFREYLADPAAASDVAGRMERVASAIFEP